MVQYSSVLFLLLIRTHDINRELPSASPCSLYQMLQGKGIENRSGGGGEHSWELQKVSCHLFRLWSELLLLSVVLGCGVKWINLPSVHVFLYLSPLFGYVLRQKLNRTFARSELAVFCFFEKVGLCGDSFIDRGGKPKDYFAKCLEDLFKFTCVW